MHQRGEIIHYITKGYTFKLEVHFDKWQKISRG